LAVHLLLILVLTGQHLITSSPHKRRQMTVNTIRIAAPSPAPVVARQVMKPDPIAKASSVSKPNVKPALHTKPVSSKPSKSIESKKVPTKQETALLKEIEQNIASIAAPKLTKKAELVIPSLSIPEEIVEEIFESPVEKLAQFLQQALQLPEFGAVRVRLSVDRLGKLQSFEVLGAKSEKNAQFLKNQLPELQFPCLNEAVSLTIVFSNEL